MGVVRIAPTLDILVVLIISKNFLKELYSYAVYVLGDIAWDLHSTHGFTIDVTEAMAMERGITVDMAKFDSLRAEAKVCKRNVLFVKSLRV